MSYTYKEIKDVKFPYRLENLNVFFSNLNCLEAIKCTIDEKGNIKNFPGILKEQKWCEMHNIGQCYDVRFEAKYYDLENDTFLMLWMIQPNGWHWVDEDGFGFSGDVSITMYSVISNGHFQHEFKLFSIDKIKYCQQFDSYLL